MVLHLPGLFSPQAMKSPYLENYGKNKIRQMTNVSPCRINHRGKNILEEYNQWH